MNAGVRCGGNAGAQEPDTNLFRSGRLAELTAKGIIHNGAFHAFGMSGAT